MNAASQIVVSIIKHLPGVHDQKSHGVDIREALYAPLEEVGSPANSLTGDNKLHAYWNQTHGQATPTTRKEILDFASNQLLPDEWQKRYQTLYTDHLALGKDSETAAFDAGKKLLDEFENVYGSTVREGRSERGWETRRYGETAEKYDAGKGTPHAKYIETLLQLKNARQKAASSSPAKKLDAMHQVDALVEAVKTMEKTKANRHPDYGQFTWQQHNVPMELQKQGGLHFESPSHSSVDVIENTDLPGVNKDWVHIDSPFGRVSFDGPKAKDKAAKMLLATYGIPSHQWLNSERFHKA